MICSQKQKHKFTCGVTPLVNSTKCRGRLTCVTQHKQPALTQRCSRRRGGIDPTINTSSLRVKVGVKANTFVSLVAVIDTFKKMKSSSKRRLVDGRLMSTKSHAAAAPTSIFQRKYRLVIRKQLLQNLVLGSDGKVPSPTVCEGPIPSEKELMRRLEGQKCFYELKIVVDCVSRALLISYDVESLRCP